MKRTILVLTMAGLISATLAAEGPVILRYSHMNEPDSIAGKQATFFAQKVKEYSQGNLIVEVYPASQLGSLQEQAAQVAAGVVAINHNTAAGIGSLYEDFAVLDTPFLFSDPRHLLRVVDLNSPLMRRLNEGLIKKSGVRVLSTFYFGARDLTADRAVYRPDNLKGVKIRSIPFPIYMTAVEGLGAIPTPIDWAETRSALKSKLVAGQENPVNIILSSKLYEVQTHLILTHHILGAEIMVMNQQIWAGLSRSNQAILQRAAAEAAGYASNLTIADESKTLAALKEKGMTVIGPAEGLDIEAFRKRTQQLVSSRFGTRWADLYGLITTIK